MYFRLRFVTGRRKAGHCFKHENTIKTEVPSGTVVIVRGSMFDTLHSRNNLRYRKKPLTTAENKNVASAEVNEERQG